jgi:hypothetical protein
MAAKGMNVTDWVLAVPEVKVGQMLQEVWDTEVAGKVIIFCKLIS